MGLPEEELTQRVWGYVQGYTYKTKAVLHSFWFGFVNKLYWDLVQRAFCLPVIQHNNNKLWEH